MCIINSFSITKIKDSPFSLFSHGIRAQGEKNPNYFRFIRESILGNLLVTVFHSGHLSHLLKLSDQPYRHKKTLTAGDFFGDLFSAKSFSDTDHTIRCAKRRSSSFLKAPKGDSQPCGGHALFFSGGLNLTRRRVEHFRLKFGIQSQGFNLGKYFRNKKGEIFQDISLGFSFLIFGRESSQIDIFLFSHLCIYMCMVCTEKINKGVQKFFMVSEPVF